MNFKKKTLIFCILVFAVFTGCKMNANTTSPTVPHASKSDDINPSISSTTSVSQNFIFNNNSVGFTTITIRRSEWNKMLSYYDYFYKNENNVIAESYEYEKDGLKWKLNTVGLRLRGNTSRYRPQGKDFPKDETGHEKPNYSWDDKEWGYYHAYSTTCPDDDYRQSHFKVDFEPLSGDDRKMADCMKGVALKRPDNLFSKEIFCYNLFHQYGIWTAPRASQTKVYINIIEDVGPKGGVILDISECNTTEIDYGVYEMFEEVNKQSLKGRMSKKNNNTAPTAWKNNDGDLWKCSGGDLSVRSNNPNNFGCEEIEIFNTDKPKSQWTWKWYNPCYDLKTNKANIDIAASKFQGFISELNSLSNYDKHTEYGIQARKDFYEKWFDVDFFIKSYAVNILVGMDDDYWGNANNYYLYFDNGSGGSGKCYFIPFDYDNTLGASITGDKVYTNPFEWGNGNDRPLLDRLLEVPEYAEKMRKTLLEVSSQASDSPWNKENCFDLWNKWHNQVRPYVYSSDLAGWIGATSINDDGCWKEHKHYLTQDYDNIYEQVSLNFRYWLSESEMTLKFDLNGGTLNGESGVVNKTYNGINPGFDAIIGTPTRPGYEFIGWTKTKNGTDYKDRYDGESDFTVYASWVYVADFSGLTIYEIKDSSYKGIKIGIANLPDNHYRRTFKINGKEVGSDSADGSKYNKYLKLWAYPFTEPGKTYEVEVSYANEGYGHLKTSNKLTIKAESGLGEFKVINNPEYYIKDNLLKWKTEPVIQVGNGVFTREDNNWNEYYLLELESKRTTIPGKEWSWNYISWNYLGASANINFNFKDHINQQVVDGTYYDLCFKLRYNYNNSPYGDLFMILYDYNDVESFNIK